MLADAPTDPELLYFLAMEHQSLGEAPEALKCFQELMTLAPDYVPTYVQAGQLLNRLEPRGRGPSGVSQWHRGGARRVMRTRRKRWQRFSTPSSD